MVVWGFSSNSIFSSVLYLLLNSGVSFRVFVSGLGSSTLFLLTFWFV